MTPLEPDQLWVFRIHAWLGCLAALAVAGIGELINLKVELVPGGTILLVMAILMIWPAFIAPGRLFRSYRWKAEGEELQVHHGHLTRIETIVPFRRVQHIDVSQGALERAFHVTSLILHTAGTVNHRVVLPGLDRTKAEKIRDDVRAVIAKEADE